ncbi:MAG: TrkH family potassium uptake protein [Tannerellaceae bacterium]|jgi:trk system potassium uptake protein TrkH|nr:TrkH family potassium uptake protein [Tannerellaceae bacterium]
MNIRFVIKMLGSMFILETIFMLLATAVAFMYEGGDFYPLLISSGLLFGCGIIFYLAGMNANEYAAGRREGMLVVALTWTLLSLFGMLPFYIGGYIDNVTDAYFETMSGFTTTGASILTDIEALPKGILFWRSLTQWQGGIGVVVFTVALLPILGKGASQMFDAETTGITHERFRPRVTQVAKRLSGVYILFTVVLAGLLYWGPMDLYDAANHALTTMSTGGYSTKNASIAHWHSSYIEYIVMLFMFIGSINMTLLYFLVKGSPKKLFADEEVRWFFFFVLVVIVISSSWLLYNDFVAGMEEAFRKAAFQVISLISSTGFSTADYLPWGPFFWLIALSIMFVGGCAGSTSGGLKMSRFVVLNKNLSNVFLKQTHPNAILPVRMNGRIVSEDIVHRILAFVFVYISLILASCLVLMLDGMGFEETIGATISAISNVGPALGDLGPTHNYAGVPTVSKWFLSFLMMVGRLEIFTVLTILLPGFWKR